MKPATKRFASIVISLMFLSGALVVYFTFIQGEYEATMIEKAQRDTRQQFVVEQTENIKKIQELINSYNDRVAAQHVVSIAVPVGPDTASLIAQMNTLASQYNLQFSSFTVANTSAAAQNNQSSTRSGATEIIRRSLNSLTFQVRLAGSYASIKSFLSSIENNLRVMDVKTFSMSPVDPTRDSYTADVAITTYYQQPN
jgi:Tfp pilus assembly protein PilO